MAKERLFLIDVLKNEAKQIKIDVDDLDKFYELLNCDCFDIPHMKIGGKFYDVFCDDCGLLKENQPPISAYSIKERKPMLVGNLIIANHDSMGNTVSLSDEDVERIKENLITAFSQARPNGYTLLSCEY